jgi:hypothetical protein
MLATPVSAGFGLDTQTATCSPSSGWSDRVKKFRAMPLSKQLEKVEFQDGVWRTHGIGAKRVMGIIDGRLRSFLDYTTTDNGPRYRLVLDESIIGSTRTNFHYAYQIELLVDGKLVTLSKAGENAAFPVCGANNQCTTQMKSYYIIDPELFAKIEGLPDGALLPLRITRQNAEYRPCRDFIAAAEFKLLRAAIGQAGT